MKHNQINFLFIVLFALGLGACSKSLDTVDEDQLEKNKREIQEYLTKNNLSATQDSTGMFYIKRVTNPQGAKAKVGDVVAIYQKSYTLNDRAFDSTRTSEEKPLRFKFGVDEYVTGMVRAVSLMRVGEKMTLFLPYTLAYGEVSYDVLPAFSPIRVEMEFAEIPPTEDKQIADYIAKKNYKVSETTASGVRIIRQNTVTGDMIGNGKTVNVNYVGKLLNDIKFDEGTLSATPGSKGLIPGFEEGVSRLRKGEKAILIFPSSLGYGARGAGADIGAYTPLIFEIEVLQ